MPKLSFNISMSLDGFIAGPDADLDNPLGVGGEQLHEWGIGTKSWREAHGLDGGEGGPDSDLLEELMTTKGATILGRRMFSGGSGPWENDPNPDAWWGDEPPFHHPVFVLTHHEREPLVKQGTTFTFVTEGIEAALDQAQEAAGDRDVVIGGGANVAQQYLRSGLLDELQIHLVPVLLGGGVRLFDDLGPNAPALESTGVVSSPNVTHLMFRVVT